MTSSDPPAPTGWVRRPVVATDAMVEAGRAAYWACHGVATVQETVRAILKAADKAAPPQPELPPVEPRGCPTPGACSCNGDQT